MTREATSPKVSTRRSRIIGFALILAFCIVYLAAFALDRENLVSHNEVKGWTTAVACCVGIVLCARRLWVEFTDPEAGQRWATERAERHAAENARPYSTGLKVFLSGIALLAVAGAFFIAGAETPGAIFLVAGMVLFGTHNSPSDWRKRWPRDFPIVARIFGRWEPDS